jgi:hypothetical protein
MIMHKVFIVLALIIAMFTGASNEAKREILASKRADKLLSLSLEQLGQERVRG